MASIELIIEITFFELKPYKNSNIILISISLRVKYINNIGNDKNIRFIILRKKNAKMKEEILSKRANNPVKMNKVCC